jgi:hypothetical protein
MACDKFNRFYLQDRDNMIEIRCLMYAARLLVVRAANLSKTPKMHHASCALVDAADDLGSPLSDSCKVDIQDFMISNGFGM